MLVLMLMRLIITQKLVQVYNLSLNLYVGPCAVIEVEKCEDGKIGLEHLPDELPAQNLFGLKFSRFFNWNSDFGFFVPS